MVVLEALNSLHKIFTTRLVFYSACLFFTLPPWAFKWEEISKFYTILMSPRASIASTDILFLC